MLTRDFREQCGWSFTKKDNKIWRFASTIWGFSLPHPVDLIHEELGEVLLELVLLPLRDVHSVVTDLHVGVPAKQFIHALLEVPTRQITIDISVGRMTWNLSSIIPYPRHHILYLQKVKHSSTLQPSIY